MEILLSASVLRDLRELKQYIVDLISQDILWKLITSRTTCLEDFTNISKYLRSTILLSLDGYF